MAKVKGRASFPLHSQPSLGTMSMPEVKYAEDVKEESDGSAKDVESSHNEESAAFEKATLCA